MLLPFLALLALGEALRIVEDFRVVGLNKSPIKAREAVVPDTSYITFNDSVESSAPSFTLAPDVQILYTDSSLSIYYMNSNISSSSSTSRFPVLLDTGSSLSWVYNASCTVNGCKSPTTTKLDPPSDLQLGDAFTLSYSGDKVSGEMFSLQKNNFEIIFCTENNQDKLLFDDFSMGLTENSPSMFSDFIISGLIGISAKESSENLVQQLYASDKINLPQFGIYLVSKPQTIKYTGEGTVSNYGGLILFGNKTEEYRDQFVGKNKFGYADVVPDVNSYWLIDIDEIKLVNSTDTSSISKRQAILDTGTTGLALPLKDANNIHKLLFGDDFVSDNNGNYAFPCSTTNNITFAINDNLSLDLQASTFEGSRYELSGLEGYCASKIQGVDSLYWILGSTFMSQFYTTFDLENKRIGFGELDLDSYTLNDGGSSDVSKNNGTRTTNTSKSASSSSLSSSTLSSKTGSQTSSLSTSSNSTSTSNSSGVTNPKSIFTSLIFLVLALVL